MSTAHRRLLTLELDPADMPLVGIVRDERGTSWPFSGWLGLASALEIALGLRSSELAAPDTPPSRWAHKSPEPEIAPARTSINAVESPDRGGGIEHHQSGGGGADQTG